MAYFKFITENKLSQSEMLNCFIRDFKAGTLIVDGFGRAAAFELNYLLEKGININNLININTECKPVSNNTYIAEFEYNINEEYYKELKSTFSKEITAIYNTIDTSNAPINPDMDVQMSDSKFSEVLVENLTTNLLDRYITSECFEKNRNLEQFILDDYFNNNDQFNLEEQKFLSPYIHKFISVIINELDTSYNISSRYPVLWYEDPNNLKNEYNNYINPTISKEVSDGINSLIQAINNYDPNFRYNVMREIIHQFNEKCPDFKIIIKYEEE